MLAPTMVGTAQPTDGGRRRGSLPPRLRTPTGHGESWDDRRGAATTVAEPQPTTSGSTTQRQIEGGAASKTSTVK